MAETLTERELDVLASLRDDNDGRTDLAAKGYNLSRWSRPLDVGGGSGSHHSATLARLAAKGLTERRQRSALSGRRGSWEYRISELGRKTLLPGQPPAQEGAS